MSEEEYVNVYQLRAASAARLAEDPAGLRAELERDDPGNGDALMLMLRFIEGRERRELDLPDEDEFEVVAKHYAEVVMFKTMFDLVIKGFMYVDVEPDPEGGMTTAFGLSAKGREAVERGEGLGL